MLFHNHLSWFAGCIFHKFKYKITLFCKKRIVSRRVQRVALTDSLQYKYFVFSYNGHYTGLCTFVSARKLVKPACRQFDFLPGICVFRLMVVITKNAGHFPYTIFKQPQLCKISIAAMIFRLAVFSKIKSMLTGND